MTMLECPHCGYMAETIDFVSCPGCGCRAREEYRRVSGTSGSDPDQPSRGGSKEGYRGLGLAAAHPGCMPEGTGSEASPILLVCSVTDHPMSSLVVRWYLGLSPSARAGYDGAMFAFSSPWIKRAIAVLGLRERSVLFRKVVELVAHDMGIRGGPVYCETCTYYLGGTSCHLQDMGLTEGTTVSGDGCPFFIPQLDTDHLERRLRFLLVETDRKG